MRLQFGRRAGFACLVTAGLLALSGASHAASDEECAARVAKACGKALLGDCFSDEGKWSEIGEDCIPAAQTLVENERDALESEKSAIDPVGMAATSYGGILRKGPGMDSAKVASLKLGDRIEILEDPEIWMDGYKWFKVRTARGTGYHWGGIFCVPGDKLPVGIFDNCQLMEQQ